MTPLFMRMHDYLGGHGCGLVQRNLIVEMWLVNYTVKAKLDRYITIKCWFYACWANSARRAANCTRMLVPMGGKYIYSVGVLPVLLCTVSPRTPCTRATSPPPSPQTWMSSPESHVHHPIYAWRICTNRSPTCPLILNNLVHLGTQSSTSLESSICAYKIHEVLQQDPLSC